MTMEVLVSRGCGLDVHQATVVACLLTGEPGRLPRKQVKTFSAMTNALIELRDWLKSESCMAVAMEATGVYWKPVYDILEGHFELIVATVARPISKRPNGQRTCCAHPAMLLKPTEDFYNTLLAYPPLVTPFSLFLPVRPHRR